MLERLIKTDKYTVIFDDCDVFCTFRYDYVTPIKKRYVEHTLDKYMFYIKLKYRTDGPIYNAMINFKDALFYYSHAGFGERRGRNEIYFGVFKWWRFKRVLKKTVEKPKPLIKVNKRKFLKLLTADGASSQRPGERF